MRASTTVRIDRDTREQLRTLEQRLGLTTSEALDRAVEALRKELLWSEVEAFYDETPESTDEDEAWIRQVGRAQG